MMKESQMTEQTYTNKFLPKLKEILAAERFSTKQGLILSKQIHHAETEQHYEVSPEEDALWTQLTIKLASTY